MRVALVALASLLAAIGVFHQPLWLVSAAVFLPMITIALDLPSGIAARLGQGTAPGSATASESPAASGSATG